MDLTSAHSLIWKAMLDHKLFDLGWSFEWNQSKTMCGVCFLGRKKIALSAPIAQVNEESEVRDTILHEIAHALVGPGHAHNFVWKSKAEEIGARPITCAVASKAVPGKYVGRCTGCGVEIQRHRRPRYIATPGMYAHTPCKRAGKPSDIEWTKKS